MKSARMLACGSLLLATAWAEVPCRGVARAEIQVPRANVFLADLLAPESCPELLRAAARVRLGGAPLAGCPRVLEGEAVRARLQTLAQNDEVLQGRILVLEIPPRVVLRGAASTARAPSGGRPSAPEVRTATLVNPGQKLQLVWEQLGIRLKVPAICLESGNAGESVRARVGRGGRVVRALVLPDGSLLVQS